MDEFLRKLSFNRSKFFLLMIDDHLKPVLSHSISLHHFLPRQIISPAFKISETFYGLKSKKENAYRSKA